MSRFFNYATWFLLLILLSISFPLFAQDVTEPPTATATVTQTLEPSSVATEAQPTIELPTLPPATAEAVLPSETPIVEQTSETTEAVLPTGEMTAEVTAPADNTGEATAEQTEAVIPTLTNTATEPAPLLPEPVLTPVLSEAFHTNDLSSWNVGAGWSLVPQEQGFALEVTNSDAPVVSNVAVYADVAVEMLVQTQTGTLNLHVRQTEIDGYKLAVNPNGQVDLYHGELLLATANVTPAVADQWRHVRFSVMGDTLRLAIDATEVIALRDTTPVLTAGAIFFNATFPVQPDDSGQQLNILLVDNIRFWIPEANVPMVTPTETPISAAEATIETSEEIIPVAAASTEDDTNIVFGVETISVSVSSAQQLIDEINAANQLCTPTSSEATVITLTNDITLTQPIPGTVNGLPIITCDITIISPNTRWSISRSPAASQFRILRVDPTGTLRLDNVTIAGGYSSDGGGGIDNRGTLEINNSYLFNNTAISGGGGIFANGGTVTITSSTLDNNHSWFGAAIRAFGTIVNVTGTSSNPSRIINHNDRTAISIGGTLTVDHTVISQNTGRYIIEQVSGGRIASISDSYIQNNQGRIIWIPSQNGSFSMDNVVVSDNRFASDSTYAGGIAIYPGSNTPLQITNSIFANNESPYYLSGTGKAIHITLPATLPPIEMSGNCIVGNDDLAITVSGGTLQAQDNWWGDALGPSGPGGDPSSIGDAVPTDISWYPPRTIPYTGLDVLCDETTLPQPPPPQPRPPAPGGACSASVAADVPMYSLPNSNSATTTLVANTQFQLLEIQRISTDGVVNASWYEISLTINGASLTRYLPEGTVISFSTTECEEDDVTEVTYETIGGGGSGGGSAVVYQDRPPAPNGGLNNECVALVNSIVIRESADSSSSAVFPAPAGAFPQIGSKTVVGGTTWYFVNYFQQFVEPNEWRFYLYNGWFDGTGLGIASFSGCSNIPEVSNPATPPPSDSSQPGVIVSVNQPIVFTNSYGGDGEIYITNGFVPTALTNNTVEDTNPSFSPTGQQIAFQSRRNNDWGIYIMNVDGTNEMPLVINNAIEPDWYPDTTTPALVFARDSELYRINADGTGESQLTNHGSGEAHDPAVSNGGDWIVYEHNGSLYVIDGICVVLCVPNLLQSGGINQFPAWSPNDDKLAFSVNENLYTATVDTSNSPQLTLTDVAELIAANSLQKDIHPTWSGDGLSLIFESDRDDTKSLYQHDFGANTAKIVQYGRRPSILAYQSTTYLYTVTTVSMDSSAQDCTLIEAIEAINNPPTVPQGCEDNRTPSQGLFDTIVLEGHLGPNPPQPYVLNNQYQSETTTNGFNGLPLVSRSILFVGNGATIQANTDANDASKIFRIMEIGSNIVVTLQDITFTGGYISQGGGGAIFTDGGTIILQGCFFSANNANAVPGGSIYAINSTVQVSGTTFLDNLVTNNNGGAIYAENSTVDILNSTFTLNQTTSSGGAIYFSNTTFRIEGNVFTSNNSTGNGGGIASTGQTDGSSITYVNFVSNLAGNGGGFWTDSEQNISISHSLFQSNTALSTGTGNAAYIGNQTNINQSCFINNSGAPFDVDGNGVIQGSNWWGNPPDNSNLADNGIILPTWTSCGTRRLYASYFNGFQVLDEPISRTDLSIGYSSEVDWRDNDALILADDMPTEFDLNKFSVRWTGYIRPDVDGTIQFKIVGLNLPSDGIRMWLYNTDMLSGDPVFETWAGSVPNITPINISASKQYVIWIEYYHYDITNTGNSSLQIQYSLDGGTNWLLIPSLWLIPKTIDEIDLDGTNRPVQSLGVTASCPSNQVTLVPVFPGRSKESEDMLSVAQAVTSPFVTGSGLIRHDGPVFNSMRIEAIPWGTTISVDGVITFSQFNSNQLWYRYQGNDTWVNARWPDKDENEQSRTYFYIVGASISNYPCANSESGVPNITNTDVTIDFTYDRRLVADYAIENSYAANNNPASAFQTEQGNRVTLPYVADIYAKFLYRTDVLSGQIGGTGSAMFISEAMWVGGLPMTLGGSQCVTSNVNIAGWRYCPGIIEDNTPSDIWKYHVGIYDYYTGFDVPQDSRGNITLFDNNILIGRGSHLGIASNSSNPGDIWIGFPAPQGASNVEQAKDGLMQLYNNHPELETIQRGDYIYINSFQGENSSSDNHGFIVVGWGIIQTCNSAWGALINNEVQHLWNLENLSDDYQDNYVPYVVDYSGTQTRRTQRTTPRPFYCSYRQDDDVNADGVYGELVTGIDLNGNNMLDNTPENTEGVFGRPHNWYFMTPTNNENQVVVKARDLYVPEDWQWEN